MELPFGDQEVGRSKNASGLSQQMDFSRDSGRSGENGEKSELCSPGPSTPMQVASLAQQKPGEASTSCPHSATTGSAHSFGAAKRSCELQLASGASLSLPASTQDAVQGETKTARLRTVSNECSFGGARTLEASCLLLSAVEDDVGHPAVSGDLATMGGATTAALEDEAETRVPSTGMEEEASMSSCGAIERAGSDRSMTSMGRTSSSVKAESGGFTLDAGLSLGSSAVQLSGRKERRCVDVGLVWENAGERSGRSGDCDVGRGEGGVVSQAWQGRGENGEGEKGEVGMSGEWKGERLRLSLRSDAEEKVEGGRVDGNVEHRFRGVLERGACGGGEHGCGDGSDDPMAKRVKREVVETRVGLDEPREQTWERNEGQGRTRSSEYENKQEDIRSPFWGNGGAALFQQSYRENAFGRVVEVGSSEPRTVVVKKTPKRVHNSDPHVMFTRSELLMLENSMRSPGSVPGAMFSPFVKQGTNGTAVASDLMNSSCQHLYKKSADTCGRDRGAKHSTSTQDGATVLLSQLESRLDRGSACSPMSTSKLALPMSEPSLPFGLYFTPKPQRPVAPITRTSTEEEWGKSLALCGPGAESPSAAERSGGGAKALRYQERFVQLQVFLKKCDEDDQSYLLDALRSLSAAGRSSHAVGLEQRALWLSMEEGKEMARLKALNVMGQRSGRSEGGCTPQGPRVAPFGSGAEYAEQQALTSTRSPQVQMAMAGSMAGSGHKEGYGCG